MNIEEILIELREAEEDGSLQIFRKLITCGSTSNLRKERGIPSDGVKWTPVLSKLLELLGKNRDYGKEQILLIPHAFVSLLYQKYEVDEFESILQSYFQLDSNLLHSIERDYNIQDIDLFKLLITHGYLQLNQTEIYARKICELPFEVLYENCIRYTRYTYLAYKVLHAWLQRTWITDFWQNSDPSLERKLETIIFSNWDNSIKEVSKQNSTSIFSQYLKIMDNKYKGFIHFVFKNCLENISWLNETKYVILSQIFDVSDNVTSMANEQFILAMLTCLTKNYLRSSGTKLYNILSNKLTNEQWKDAFGNPIKTVILNWRSGPRKDDQALHLLCTQWLEPTIVKHRAILPFLWELSNDVADRLVRSHLERIASQTSVSLEKGDVWNLIDDCDEYLRLNSFATNCQKNISFEHDDLMNHFSVVKHFLFYNVNSSSTYLRRGIIKYWKIFFLNLLKSCRAQRYYNEEIFSIFEWLHEFILDSFEIGSSYQRKILGIKLYDILLFYTNERDMSYELKNDPRYREGLTNGFKVTQELKSFTKSEWKLTNRTSLLWLLKLILDPATDVRELSAEIILEHFKASSLNNSEKKALLDTAIMKCNSAKFYETESGSTLTKILSKWLPFDEVVVLFGTELVPDETIRRFYQSRTTHTKYIDYMLSEAQNQLVHVKQDILKAATHNSPFHGTLTTILNVGYRNNLKTELITADFTENLLKLLENAVQFLLSLLSPKSGNCEFSSSFAEMGLAIDKTVKDSEINDDYDHIILSPAHQLVITCIWLSLKVSCELASEIGMLMYSHETVERSANLITSILTKCRHKGAIEAAGVAIGHLTRKLVSTEEYSKFPERWLNDLTSGQDINPNLTRRSAGLSIMFHRIVANDTRHGRPLVHIAIHNLLNLLHTTAETGKHHGLREDDESYQDLPRAKHLHFLQRLVADSDLHAQVVPYLERITIECFKDLQSQIWTVRNASLQLFGAIVPRIAGQQNGGQTLDFGHGYSVDHFITHYSELAQLIFSELKIAATKKSDLNTIFMSHSAIVPSLILLSRMSTGGSDFIDYSSKMYIHEAKRYLKLLFDSPIGNVRILAAKAYAALVSFPEIGSEYENLKESVVKIDHRNHAHGYMCAIKYLNEKLKTEEESVCYNVERSAEWKENISPAAVEKIWNDMWDSKVESSLCYIVEAMSLMVSEDFYASHDVFLFKEIGQQKDIVLNIESSKPGFGEFIDTSTRLYVDVLNRSDNIDESIIKRILKSQCIDQSLSLLNNLKPGATVRDIILKHMLQVFPNCEDALLDAMVHYLNKSMINSTALWDKSIANADEIRNEVCNLLKIINGNHRYSKLEQFCYILINVLYFDSESIDATVNYCCTKVMDNDEVVRKLAAECLPCLLLNFSETSNRNKLKIFKLCLSLLKDDVSDIKEIARISLANYFGNDLPTLGEILYHKILAEILIDGTKYARFSTVEILQFFSEWLMSINFTKDFKATVESPFDHEDDATCAEEAKLLNIIFYSISHLGKQKIIENNIKIVENILDCRDTLKSKNIILSKASIDFSDLKTILDLSHNDYIYVKKTIVLDLCELIRKYE